MISIHFKDVEDLDDVEVVTDNNIYTGLLSLARVDRETVPKGWYVYDIRHSDDDGGDPAEIKNGYIFVNHFGTFLTKEKLPIEEGKSLYFDNKNIFFGYL